MASKKGLGSIQFFSLGLGVVLGVVISHVFKSAVDGVWKFPVLNAIPSNYARHY